MALSVIAEVDRLAAEFISKVFAAIRAAPLGELAEVLANGSMSPSPADRRSRSRPVLNRETRPSRHRPTFGHAGVSKRVRVTHAERRERRLQRAREWQRQLDAGEISSRAAIARREGVSRARVTQLMNLLNKRR